MKTTDQEWERWGRQDPYFAVLTDPRFRTASITDEDKTLFFESGRHHAHTVLDACRRHVDPAFAPRRVLDFGCGVGRVALPFAEMAETVVGLDVSPSMLEEARRNCEERGVRNVEFLLSDNHLSALQGKFDLVHSCIVFQHIEAVAGRRLFRRLLDHLADGGLAAIQITYGKAYHPHTFGRPPAALTPAVAAAQGRLAAARAAWRGIRKGLFISKNVVDQMPDSPSGADPEMQMNPYSLNELAFMMQMAGVARFHAEFTNHGGELGVFLYFRKPAPAAE